MSDVTFFSNSTLKIMSKKLKLLRFFQSSGSPKTRLGNSLLSRSHKLLPWHLFLQPIEGKMVETDIRQTMKSMSQSLGPTEVFFGESSFGDDCGKMVNFKINKYY